jgi:hypothetical protein
MLDRDARRRRSPVRRRRRTDDDYDQYDEYDEYEDDDDYDDYIEPSRWVALVSTVGMAMIGVVTVQVVASLIQGFTIKTGERLGQGLRDDLFHRLGYPFDNLGSTALLFLVLGVVLLALPSALDEYVPERQDRAVGMMLKLAIAMAVIVAIGSVLAVRATLHNYSANNVAAPTSVRIQFTTFLLGALGAAAVALYAAITALGQRARERWED